MRVVVIVARNLLVKAILKMISHIVILEFIKTFSVIENAMSLTAAALDVAISYHIKTFNL